MHIALITAGGAGMFCGSCMHDNTWARALMAAGSEVSLLPTYTPIRLDDEPNVSDGRLFLGGINVYLDYRWKFWRGVPRGFTRWLDAPWVVNLAARFSVRNDARRLGDLTLAMLAGEQGPQRREVAELARFVGKLLRPDVVVFSNALLSGAVRSLRDAYDGPVYCTLQGDDVFLDALPDSHRQRAVDAVSERAQQFDGYLVHSRFYRGRMSEYLRLPAEKFHQVPLGIDLAGHDGRPGERRGQPFTVGFFARIATEKGLHHLAEAFRLLHARHPQVRLRAGGYLGRQDRGYLRHVTRTLNASGSLRCRHRVGGESVPTTAAVDTFIGGGFFRIAAPFCSV
jgi:glycosyltransferase involved in cell wall biosynthesis